MDMEQTISILIVENDKDYAWLLKNELERRENLSVAGICSGSEDAVDAACRLKPDIVLMDLHLGNTYEDGIQASKKIRVQTDAKVLILTALHSPEVIKEAMAKSFASGYIMKDQILLLVENIYALAEGTTGQERILLQSALACLTPAGRSAFEIMMGEENQSRSRSKTISNQKTQVLKKLQLKNRTQLQHVFRALKE